MKKQNLILSSALAALFSSSMIFAEVEVSGKIIQENAYFTQSGASIGDTSEHGKDAFKSETSVKLFFDGDAGKESTFHVEVQGVANGEAVDDYDSVESYTQRDSLREAYIDTEVGDWSIRAGKQQVVWGTADGMKLLDMINPTDYSEMAQNQMEDSRIPIWMINAEKDLANGANIQVIVSQPKENVFAGINRNIDTSIRANGNGTPAGIVEDTTLNNGTDTGHAFMMKGPNTITGTRDGFLNIVPDLGSVAARFSMAFESTNPTTPGLSNLNNPMMEGFTVNAFKGMTMGQMKMAFGGGLPVNFQNAVNQVATALGRAADSITGQEMLAYGFQPLYNSNLSNMSAKQDSAFDYMGNTTFRTFNTFINAKSQYVYNMPKDNDVDLAFRFKNSTAGGTNYSLNASYNYDKNPIVNLSWRGDAGQELKVHKVISHYTMNTSTGALTPADPLASVPSGSIAHSTTTLQVVDTEVATLGTKDATHDKAFYETGVYGGNGKAPTLRFSQEVKRMKQLGGSFDTAIESKIFGPVVIRGEALYTMDGYSPVMNKDELAIGGLVAALQMKKADRFKYVLGMDVTMLTNMLVSMQIIQDRNLDYVENGNEYTTDYATMNLANGFNKAEKNKEFYSLFFSKPFGASGEHRWNNIFMFEENGGKWNRLDAEFSINDDVQATVEYNKYWGDENTQFGQLKDSSNVQAGIKYSF